MLGSLASHLSSPEPQVTRVLPSYLTNVDSPSQAHPGLSTRWTLDPVKLSTVTTQKAEFYIYKGLCSNRWLSMLLRSCPGVLLSS